MSSPRSHRSADSTSDSSEQGCESSRKPKSTRGEGESSPPGSPESPSTTTYALYEPARTLMDDGTIDENWNRREIANALAKPTGTKDGLLISSQAGFPVRTSPLPVDAPDSPANDPACSSSSPGSQMSFDQAGFSLRTSLGSSVLPTAETLGSFSQRWPTSGMAWRGGFSTLVSSEFPSAAVECSLSDVLVESPSGRYALSARAATGILRRAAARGRALPPELQAALEALAGGMADAA